MCNSLKETFPHPLLWNIDMETVLPFVLVPLVLYIGATGFTMTVIVMIVLAMSLLYVLQRPSANKGRTQFFFMWTLSSLFYLVLVFEGVVMGLLEVTQMENVLFVALLAVVVWCFHRVRSYIKGKDYDLLVTENHYHCPVCQIEINNRYFHSVWLDTCISSTNYAHYMLGLVLAEVCLLYGANLGLTTVCQPFVLPLLTNVLMPEDCSDVYYEYDLAICFMASVYSLSYAVCIALILLHQCIRYVPRHLGFACSKKRTATILPA